MKHLIFMLTLFLLMAFVGGLAEPIADFSEYSLEDLISMRASIEAEINERVSAGTATLIPGLYVAGVDIVSGSYILVGIVDKGSDGYTPEALCYESMDAYDKWDSSWHQYLSTNETYRITLDDGMVLRIVSGNIAIQQAPPMLFAPE